MKGNHALSQFGAWYGCYLNGREFLLAIEDVRAPDLDAVYAFGPGIDENEPSE